MPSLLVSLPKGQERGGGLPWELSARRGTRSASPRVTEETTGQCQKQSQQVNREVLGKEGTWPASAGKGGELQLEEGAEEAEAEAPNPRMGLQV